MIRRQLGRTSLAVSRLGFGAASLWGMPFYDEAQAHAVLAAALDAGVNYIDTGPTYSSGNAEPRLGRLLARRPERHDLVVSTKVGTRFGDNGRLEKDFSPASVRRSVEQSLQRLGLQRLPLLLLHGPGLADFSDELLGCLADMRREGLIGHAGVNSFDGPVLARLPDLAGIEVAMLDYNLLRLGREPLIERLAGAGVGVLAGEPLAQHIFSGRPLKLRAWRDIWYLARALRNRPRDLALRRRYRFLSGRPEGSPAQLALAFVLNNPGVAAAVFSTTRLAHLQENLAAGDLVLPPDVDAAIRAAYCGPPLA